MIQQNSEQLLSVALVLHRGFSLLCRPIAVTHRQDSVLQKCYLYASEWSVKGELSLSCVLALLSYSLVDHKKMFFKHSFIVSMCMYLCRSQEDKLQEFLSQKRTKQFFAGIYSLPIPSGFQLKSSDLVSKAFTHWVFLPALITNLKTNRQTDRQIDRPKKNPQTLLDR